MSHLIKKRRVVHDDWQLLNHDIGRFLRPCEDGLVPDFPNGANLIVPTLLWRVRCEELLDRSGRTGVWLHSHEQPESICAHLSSLHVVAIDFTGLADDRACATARLLRERYGYKGELRAIGDVQARRLPYLESCGFDAFLLRADQHPYEWLYSLEAPAQAEKAAA